MIVIVAFLNLCPVLCLCMLNSIRILYLIWFVGGCDANGEVRANSIPLNMINCMYHDSV